MGYRISKHVAGLLVSMATFFCPPLLAATDWTWTLTGATYVTGTGTFSASEATTSTSMSGTYTRPTTGFVKLTRTACTGSECAGAASTIYGVEVPGLALIIQPVLGSPTLETQPIYTLVSGSCPTSDFSSNFAFVQWSGSNDTTDPTQVAAGVVSWTNASHILSITNVYNVTSFGAIGSGFSLDSSACSGGTITVTGSGDRGGTVYITNQQALLYNTSANHSVWAVPSTAIPSLDLLVGTYNGFRFDASGSNNVKPIINMGIGLDSSNIAGYEMDTNTDTSDNSKPWTVSISAINSPAAGMAQGTVSDGTNTSNLLCVVTLATSGRNTFFCSGQSPSTNSRPFNMILTSTTGAPAAFDSNSYFGNQAAGITTLSGVFPNGMVQQSDGKIVVLATQTGTNFLLRYRINGSLDTSFNSIGSVSSPGGAHSTGFGSAVLVQPDGKIVAGGSTTATNSMRLYRFLSNGNLETDSFGQNGTGGQTQLTSLGVSGFCNGSACNLQGLMLQPDGKVLGVGYGFGRRGGVRYLSNGVLDTQSFGTSGTGGLTTVGGALQGLGTAAGCLLPDGKIVMAGHPGTTSYGAYRFLSNGVLDTGSFGTAGTGGQTAHSIFSSSHVAYRVLCQPDGKFLIPSNPFDGAKNVWALSRFLSNGLLDTGTFGSAGTGGWLTTTFGYGYTEYVRGAERAPDGKIYVIGYVYTSGTASSVGAIARFLSNGKLDTSSFGNNNTGGKLTLTDGTGQAFNYIYSLLPQSDGKLLIGTPNALIRIWP